MSVINHQKYLKFLTFHVQKTAKTDSPIKSTVTHDIKILRTASNWKLLSVETYTIIMLRLLGDKKKPLATRVKQTLKLVEAVRDVSDVTIPKTMSMILYKK